MPKTETSPYPSPEPQLSDTVALEERARLALNALTGGVDVEHGNIPYMFTALASDPACLCHSYWDYGSSTGRLVAAIDLARQMSGSDYGADIEAKLRANLLEFFAEDGLNYRRKSAFNEPYANMHDQRSVLLGMTTWYGSTRDPAVKEAADKLCGALKRIALKAADYWYFPSIEYTPDGWPKSDGVELHVSADPAHTSARIIGPLTTYWRLTGNRDAFELAEMFTRHTVYYSGAFNPDGSFNRGTEFRQGHFHSRMVSVAGIAHFAQATANAEILQWVKKVYDWALAQGTAFGWFPGGLAKYKAYHHETCALVDMIDVGIVLADSGYQDYWPQVERFVRNHLVEAQLLRKDWVREAEDPNELGTAERSYRDVGARSIGGFAGWAAPNDFVTGSDNFVTEKERDWDIMTCCTSAGTHGLHLAWSNAVTEREGRVMVNLLFDRETAELEVRSHLPHEGRVDLRPQADLADLHVRIPDWVEPKDVRIRRSSRNGVDAPDAWRGSYVALGPASDGETITVSFPVRQIRTVERAWDRDYEVEWCGDDVVSISPEGKYYPLYSDRAARIRESDTNGASKRQKR